jgi:hypothetical protein
MHAVDEALYQLGDAADIAARDFYGRQRSYTRLSRHPVRRRSANAIQELNGRLKASEAYQGLTT